MLGWSSFDMVIKKPMKTAMVSPGGFVVSSFNTEGFLHEAPLHENLVLCSDSFHAAKRLIKASCWGLSSTNIISSTVLR